MFEQLANDAAARFNLSITSVSALILELILVMTNESTDGMPGFVNLFRRAGLADIVADWYEGTARQILPSQVESALGVRTLDQLSLSSGLARATVTSALTYLLPKVVG